MSTTTRNNSKTVSISCLFDVKEISYFHRGLKKELDQQQQLQYEEEGVTQRESKLVFNLNNWMRVIE
jgi:hypothetical protein